MSWHIILRGGTYDRYEGWTEDEPAALIVAWTDGHESRLTSDPHNPNVVLATAEAYRLAEVDVDGRAAVHEVGDRGPRRSVVERVGDYTGPRR